MSAPMKNSFSSSSLLLRCSVCNLREHFSVFIHRKSTNVAAGCISCSLLTNIPLSVETGRLVKTQACGSAGVLTLCSFTACEGQHDGCQTAADTTATFSR